MRSKVIIFCALLYCLKFVASTPFGEESVRQSNSWQENENNSGQYHGTDVTRTRNFNFKSGPQHPRVSNFRNRQSPLQSQPLRSQPEIFDSEINERRIKDFTPDSEETFPVRNHAQTVRPANRYGQQNWQSRNRFLSSSSGVVNAAPGNYQKYNKVEPEPYSTSQQIPVQRPNQQHYQPDNLSIGTRDFRYHHVAENSGGNRHVANTGPKPGPPLRTTHIESYNEPPAQGTNLAQSNGNTFRRKSLPYIGPDNSQNNEEYDRPVNNNYVPIRYNKFPRRDAFPTRTEFNKGDNDDTENPIITSGSGLNTYTVSKTPIEPVLDSTRTRYFNKPVINSEADDQPQRFKEYTESNSGPPNRATANYYNDEDSVRDTEESKSTYIDRDNVKPRKDKEEPLIPIDTTEDDNKTPAETRQSESPDSFGEDKSKENVYNFSDGENAKEYFLNKIKKNFVIIHANGTVEYVNHLNTENSPSYVAKNNNKPVTSFTPPPKKSNSDDKTDDSWSGSPNDNNDNESDDSYSQKNTKSRTYNYQDSFPIPHAQANQRSADTPLLKPSVVVDDYNSQSETNDNNSPLEKEKPEDNFNWASRSRGNRHRPYKSNRENERQSPQKNHLRASHSDSTTSTTPTPDDAMIEKFVDSLNKPDDDTLTPDNDKPAQTDTDKDHNSSTPPSKLHTKISPGIFRSTSTTPASNGYHSYNSNRENKRPVQHPRNSSHALHAESSTTTTPSPDDDRLEKSEDSYDAPHDNTSLTDYQHKKSKKTKLHTKPSTTKTPTRDDYHLHNKDENNQQKNLTHTLQHHHSVSTTSTPDDAPAEIIIANNEAPSSNNDEHEKFHKQTTASSKLNTKISPGIFRSTTAYPTNKDDHSHNSNEEKPSKPHKRKSHKHKSHKNKSHKHTSTTSSPNDDNFKKILDLSPDKKDNKSTKDDQSSKNDQYDSYERSSKLHKKTSSDINDELTDISTQNENDHDARIVPISSTESTPVDEIITLSPIELATDDLNDDSTPNPVNEGTSEQYNLDIIKDLSVVDEVTKLHNSSGTNSDNPVILENIDNSDGLLIQMLDDNNKDETVQTMQDKNKAKSANKDSFSQFNVPANSDDDTAAPIPQYRVNRDDTSTGDFFVLTKPSMNGLKLTLNVPYDSAETLYVNVDVDDTDKESSGDEKVSITIQRQNNSDSDLVKEINYNKKNQTNADGTAINKDMMLDLSNALVVMNKTHDKDYLNQLLSSDSKVNLFIFQMPCQEQALVERSKETTIFANGTCLEETTETTWKSRDDPTPTVITTKKYYTGSKCHH